MKATFFAWVSNNLLQMVCWPNVLTRGIQKKEEQIPKGPRKCENHAYESLFNPVG